MKYAIYDKAAEGYLTSMEFDTEVPDTEVTFSCGYNEYITEAKLLDTPKEATDAIVRIGRLKFVDKGRFVMHSFDDTLKDQYIISESGTPTKVVDNITVDLDGNINVKYGTMVSHWSATSIEYAVNRMNALQKAKDSRYTDWCNTFDIYKVIKAIDEKGFVNYQFIKVTAEGLEKYSKDEEEKLLVDGREIINITSLANKRIEELEKDNRILTDNINYHNECRLALVDMIRAIKYAICSRVSDKRVNYISYMTDKIKDDEIFNRPELKTAKNDIPKICKHLTTLSTDPLNKRIEELEKDNDASKDIANNIVDICEAEDEFDVTLKKFSELYNAVNTVYDCNNDSILYAFNAVLEILAALESPVRNIIDENVAWKHKAQKAAKDLDDQKKLNDANKATIAQMVVEKHAMDKDYETLKNKLEACEVVLDDQKKLNDANKATIAQSTTEIQKFTSIRNSLAEVIFAIRNAICNNDSEAFRCINNRMKFDPDFNSGPFMAGVRENIKDICYAEKRNIANHELKNDEIAKLSEKIEKLKSQFNSMYGYYDTDDATIDYFLHDVMITGGRCCGKQVMADILSGKKIPISKDKYDSILTSLKLIDLSYEGVYGTMIRISPKPKPTWLPGLITEIKNLTK